MKLADQWLSTLLGVLLAASSVALAVGPSKRGIGPLVPAGGSTAKVAVPKSSTQTHVASVTSDMDAALVASGGGNSALSEDKKRPMHIIFLSSDTGGGHRASAEALAKQFLIQYPGSTYELVDLWTDHGVWPYRNLVDSYKRMSAHPSEWRLFYHLSNTKLNEVCSNLHSRITCGGRIKNRLKSQKPDVMVSVHPTMNHTPLKSIHKISRELGKHIPFFTVVTDLGSAHSMWFERNVDKLYVASDRLYKLARRRGGTAPSDIVMTGLPIRHGFAIQKENLGSDRTSEQGKEYRLAVKKELDLDENKQMVLVMGGGEGVGSLSDIVNELYADLSSRGVDATVCVICGRNEKLQSELLTRNFDNVAEEINAKRTRKQKRRNGTISKLRRKFSRQKTNENQTTESSFAGGKKGNVDIMPLGFLTNIPEYMVAADVLVSKAGPGTIAEAAAVGLPIMLTSFLPGQEAGNVDVVLEKEFGEYEQNPSKIANTVTSWLKSPNLLTKMSQLAMDFGNPYASDEIVEDIGRQTQAWMELNEK